MRRSLLFILLFFVCLFTNAQYKKMPLDTNHYWSEYYYYQTMTTNLSCNYQLNIIKDTVIGSYNYKKIIITSVSCNSFVCCFSDPTKAYLRQDTLLKKVIVLDNTFQEKILYNFNKNLGDTTELYDRRINSTSVYTVTLKDSLLLNDGLYHKRLGFWGGSGPEVIEGVGGKFGFLTPYFMGFGTGANLICSGKTYPSMSTIYHSSGNTYSCSIMTNYSENNIHEENISIYPNPVQNKLQTNFKNVVKYEIMDVSGKKIIEINSTKEINTENLAPGIYFLRVHQKENVRNFKFIKE